jgi:hypothetical protein
MFSTMLSVLLVVHLGTDDSATNQVGLLIDTIESLQQPVEDFRCEYEGTIRHRGKASRTQKLGDDGLYDSFSGIFIWKRGGDTYSDSLHRTTTGGKIVRKNLVVRMREQQAEAYTRLNDAPLGIALIQKPEQVNSWQDGCPGKFFLLDKIKREAAATRLVGSVSDDQIEGRALKVLNFARKKDKEGKPGVLVLRYWIDLRRNGHVIRAESYVPGGVVSSRYDIKLASFKIGDANIWMPVFVEYMGYADMTEDKKPFFSKEPTVLETMYVVDGTMVFNKRPGPEAFTIKYKPGTPISDHLRKMNFEFGQQKIEPKLTIAAAQEMLNTQVAKAEAQKEELVVSPASEGFDWGTWTIRGFGALVLVSLVALGVQRRMH